jgi:hypothetical protein
VSEALDVVASEGMNIMIRRFDKSGVRNINLTSSESYFATSYQIRKTLPLSEDTCSSIPSYTMMIVAAA